MFGGRASDAAVNSSTTSVSAQSLMTPIVAANPNPSRRNKGELFDELLFLMRLPGK